MGLRHISLALVVLALAAARAGAQTASQVVTFRVINEPRKITASLEGAAPGGAPVTAVITPAAGAARRVVLDAVASDVITGLSSLSGEPLAGYRLTGTRVSSGRAGAQRVTFTVVAAP